MPYMGVNFFDGNNKVFIKIHGPFETLVVNPKDLREAAEIVWDKHTSNNIPNKVLDLVEVLRDVFCDGEEIVWVQVEHQTTSNGNTFGASAEKVLVQNVQT